ncbi:hypothetical protein [Streptomyces kanamyceticus]|uniref:Uncharacterized protein n=1 Tax=Streptomyces kanamyceticus TaxID=1967 RepID=A0A5J6GEB9_STRKN|nr:hypothetical protein [Streptomyces kanamyceticus]QEU92872.1 hypothetical protein CP970_19890 [Streptomyces kanamyceticus]
MSAAFDWLARALDEPQQARREWDERGVALLPLGKRFNIVCLTARLVHAAVGTADLDAVTATLAELLRGPVIYNDTQHAYYALTEPYPTARWEYAAEAPMLGSGHHLCMPAFDLTGPTGLYWAVPPRIVGDLCPLPSVAALVHIARVPLQGRTR